MDENQTPCTAPQFTLSLEEDSRARSIPPETALQLAMSGQTDALRSAIIRGCDLDHVHADNGWSALHWAARNAHTECVKLLALAGANLDIQDLDGRTSLMLACMTGETESVRALIHSGCDMDAVDGLKGWSAAHICCLHDKSHDCLALLIDSGADLKILAREGQSITGLARELQTHHPFFSSSAKRIEAILSCETEQKKLSEP